jgi:hypothetical protein
LVESLRDSEVAVITRGTLDPPDATQNKWHLRILVVVMVAISSIKGGDANAWLFGGSCMTDHPRLTYSNAWFIKFWDEIIGA